MTRLDALESALDALPPAGSDVAWVVGPERLENGSVTLPHIDNGPELASLFGTFNSGAFGFAARDRDYLAALEAWRRVHARDPLDPANAALLDRNACLLVLRQVDRAERFCDGTWAAAHASGLLHAVLRRLIALES